MKKIYLVAYFLSLTLNIFSQGMGTSDVVFNGVNYDVFKVKVNFDNLKYFDILENKNFMSHKIFLDSVNKDTSSFIITASISDSLCRPIGYFVRNSLQIQPPNLNDGKGNFYLKPNGVLLITNNDAIVCESGQLSNFSDIRLGIQSGPMLLSNGNVNLQFNPTSKNENIRCGVGISVNKKNEKFLVFCISKTEVSFYNFAMFFKEKLNCNDALCLESSGCIMNMPYTFTPQPTDIEDGVICNYIYFKMN